MRQGLIGLVAVLAAVSVAACGGSDKKSKDAGKGEGRLTMLVWPGYDDPAVVDPFADQTGCRVTAEPAGSSDEMVGKFRDGRYDLVSPSGDVALRLVDAGAVAPLDEARLTNLRDFAPPFRSPAFASAGGKLYGLPFTWGANVLIYNRDAVSPAPTSWRAIYDSRYSGRIAVPDNPMQIADPALQFIHAGNPYALGKRRLAAVTERLKRQRPLVARYWSLPSEVEEAFKSGEVTLAAGWPATTNELRKAGVNVGEVIPKEGVTGWADSWMVRKDAEHPVCAYKWMNYVTSPQTQATVAEVTGYSPVNLQACGPVGPKRCRELHLESPAYYRRTRFWQTPRAPTDYEDWSHAWTEATG